MRQQRKLTDKTKGMFSGPRGAVGQYLEGNSLEVSGTTYGGQGLGDYWYLYPGVIGGTTEIDPRTLQTGSDVNAVRKSSNLSSVQQGAKVLAKKAGLGDGVASGASVGGISY